MSKEILVVAEMLANEKNVPIAAVIEAIEGALASATKKRVSEDIDVVVVIDHVTGEYETFRRWIVIADDEIENPDAQLTLAQAQARDPKLSLGDEIREPMESVEFGRIPAHSAKQVIAQKLRAAERARTADMYEERLSELVTGTVKKVTRDYVILDLGGNGEGLIYKEELLPREVVRVGDRLRGFLYEIRREQRGPQILLSRTRPEMLIELFKIEVPEIGEELIDIRSAARDPGVRAKIAVKTNDGRIDPIGACVGMRGSRVQAVSGELGGERIDIILWDDNPAQLVINAMSPAEVTSILVDEDSHTIDIAVSEEQLSQAIGRSGQNVRLASELTGWTLNVMNEADFAAKGKKEAEDLVKFFMETISVDEDVASVLVNEGFTSLEEIAYLPEEEMLAIEGFDEEIVEELTKRARDAQLTRAIAQEERLSAVEPAQDLLELEGMNKHLAYIFASQGIVTREDLAEQAVDDLLEVAKELDQEQAAKLIMTARAHWFAEE